MTKRHILAWIATGPLLASSATAIALTGATAAHAGPAPQTGPLYTASTLVDVPASACVAKVTAKGAPGGAGGAGGAAAVGGAGAAVSGAVAVKGGSTVYVDVGERGGDAVSGDPGSESPGAGGAGGGAIGGTGLGQDGGGGGGLSDLRADGPSGTQLVAAGGGGGGGAEGPGGAGGAGGSAQHHGIEGFQIQTGSGRGENASGGRGGSSTAGGAAGVSSPAPDGDASESPVPANPGKYDTGGRGASSGDAGGGGGGGYFGGGGGAGGFGASGAGGGGGGNLVPTGGTAVDGSNTGDGSVLLTFAPCATERVTLSLSSTHAGVTHYIATTRPAIAGAKVKLTGHDSGAVRHITDGTNSTGVATGTIAGAIGTVQTVTADLSATAVTKAAMSATKHVTVAGTSWFHDPVTAAARSSEVAVPANPSAHNGGPLTFTKAYYRTHAGAIAVPAKRADSHSLIKGEAVVLNGTSLFPFNSATPSSAARTAVSHLAAALKDVTAVRCEGYSDFGGGAAHQQALSEQRATAICALIHRHHGITTSAAGYGGNDPVIIGGTPGQRARNRRVVIEVTKSSVLVPKAPKAVLPGAPHIASATSGDSTATITFAKPTSNGGHAITGYQVSTDGGTTWQNQVVHGSSPYTVAIVGLTDGQTYTVETRATTAIGHSKASNKVTARPKLVAEAPDAPQIAGGTPDYEDPGPSKADFTFTTPADNGAAITGYQVSIDGGDWTDISSDQYTPGSPNDAAIPVDYDYTGCPGDTEYEFQVRAVNSAGPGAASNFIVVDFNESEC